MEGRRQHSDWNSSNIGTAGAAGLGPGEAATACSPVPFESPAEAVRGDKMNVNQFIWRFLSVYQMESTFKTAVCSTGNLKLCCVHGGLFRLTVQLSLA